MNLRKRYRFISADNPPNKDQFELIGLQWDNKLCVTDYQQGNFYPPVTHYLIDDSDKFDRYAKAACDETINNLEQQLEQWKTRPSSCGTCLPLLP